MTTSAIDFIRSWSNLLVIYEVREYESYLLKVFELELFFVLFNKVETFFRVDDLIPGDLLEIKVNRFILAEGGLHTGLE